MIPVGYLVLVAGDEFYGAVLGDDNGQARGVFAAESVGGAMTSAGAIHGLQNAILGLDVEGAIDHFVLETGSLNLNAKAKQGESMVDQQAAIDRREVGKPERQLHKALAKGVGKFFVPRQILLPTGRGDSSGRGKMGQTPGDFLQNEGEGRGGAV